MLKDYPLMLNNTELLIPSSYKENWKAVEEVKQSAAGTDIYTSIRSRKLVASLTYKVMNGWLKTFADFNMLSRTESLTFKRYDPILDAYSEHFVKMTGFSYQLNRKSWDLEATNGIYEVSFNLEEI